MHFVHKDRRAQIICGLCFLGSFLSYGVGTAMVDPLLVSDSLTTDIANQQLSFTLAILMIVIVHSLTNLGMISILYRVLTPFTPISSMFYLALALIATIALAFGGIALWSLAPSPLWDGATSFDMQAWANHSNFYLYQMAMALWGIGGMAMCFGLLRGVMVPRALALLGIFGYATFAIGCISEFFHSGMGLILSAPGGVFEVVFSLWLIFKGFNDVEAPNENYAASSIA